MTSVCEGDLTFEAKIAKGSEGEVWRGTLQGVGAVAIKKVPLPPSQSLGTIT